MKKLFKKYWPVLVGAVLAFLGWIGISKQRNAKQINAIDADIKQNDANQNQAAGKAAAIEDQRNAVKQDIKQAETEIEITTQNKQTINPTPKKTAADAKKNILAKTNKKSKKS